MKAYRCMKKCTTNMDTQDFFKNRYLNTYPEKKVCYITNPQPSVEPIYYYLTTSSIINAPLRRPKKMSIFETLCPKWSKNIHLYIEQ